MPDIGLLIVISGPSGAGKGTVTRALLGQHPQLCYSVSATTRPPRPGEEDGKDYFFLSREEFISRRGKGDFLEWAEVYGNFYGTPKDFVNRARENGKHVVLEIDTAGAAQIREQVSDGVFIFLIPPSLTELRCRIEGRGTEDREIIERRLQAACREIALAEKYDFIVLNEQVQKAASQVFSIITAEGCRVSRNRQLLAQIVRE